MATLSTKYWLNKFTSITALAGILPRPRIASTVPQSTRVAAIDFSLSVPELVTLLPSEATVKAALVEPGGLGCSGFSDSGFDGEDSNPTTGGSRRTLEATS